MENDTPALNARFSVCVLCYGDYLSLAQRCLTSITDSFSEGVELIQDVRIGLNQPSQGMEDYIRKTADMISSEFNLPVILYQPNPPESNTFKWPLMRRMFHDPNNPLAEYAMWFDDDSFLAGKENWWRDIHEAAGRNQVIGTMRYIKINQNRWSFIKKQPWANPAIEKPVIINYEGENTYMVLFLQGAWWVMHSKYLSKFNFPFEYLRHNGGDSMMGEFCRQIGLQFGVVKKHENETEAWVKACASQKLFIETLDMADGVMLNVDEAGGEDDSGPRRGFKEVSFGLNWNGEVPSTDHQDFQTSVTVFRKDQAPKTDFLDRV